MRHLPQIQPEPARRPRMPWDILAGAYMLGVITCAVAGVIVRAVL